VIEVRKLRYDNACKVLQTLNERIGLFWCLGPTRKTEQKQWTKNKVQPESL